MKHEFRGTIAELIDGCIHLDAGRGKMCLGAPSGRITWFVVVSSNVILASYVAREDRGALWAEYEFPNYGNVIISKLERKFCSLIQQPDPDERGDAANLELPDELRGECGP